MSDIFPRPVATRTGRICLCRPAVPNRNKDFRFAQKEDGKLVQVRWHSGCKCVVGVDATDARKEVDPVRRATELNELFRGSEVRRAYTQVAESELIQDRDDFGGVLWRRADQDIEVAGEARARMKGETVRSDDQVLNAVGV